MADYAFGSDRWPGLSKLVEECGEVLQVCGKIMGTGGQPWHWDGSNLNKRLEEELGDLVAAAAFVIEHAGLDLDRIDAWVGEKTTIFDRWHEEGDPAPNDAEDEAVDDYQGQRSCPDTGEHRSHSWKWLINSNLSKQLFCPGRTRGY